jgi:CDP-glucose 4,6-dehydratase
MENIQKEFANKKILVTGHTGFKGSWLCLWLKELGAQVSGYSLPPNTNPSLYSLLNLKIPETLADINDDQALAKHLKKYPPEIIFHLAAQPLVRESYIDPIGTFKTNITGTWNLLKAAQETPSVKAIIVITTDKCYRNPETGKPFVESDALGGHDPYSASKACVEIICASWRSSFLSKPGSPLLATARAGNVIGGGDWAADRLISDCVRAFAVNKTVELRYSNALRPWQHVLEPLSGYLMLAEKLYNFGSQYAEAWNFGPGQEGDASVKDIATIAAEAWGDGRIIETASNNNLHEANLLRLDITKSRTELGWLPKWDIKTAIIETMAWYKKWHQGDDMLDYSLSQIKKYTTGNK